MKRKDKSKKNWMSNGTFYYNFNNSRYDDFQKNVGYKMVTLQNAVAAARKEQAKFDCDYNLFLVITS